MTTYSEVDLPEWFQKKRVDEVLFCEALLEELPMICIHDSFFTVDGRVTDENQIKNRIYEKLKPVVRTGLSRKVSTLLDALRSECYSPSLMTLANWQKFCFGMWDLAKRQGWK